MHVWPSCASQDVENRELEEGHLASHAILKPEEHPERNESVSLSEPIGPAKTEGK